MKPRAFIALALLLIPTMASAVVRRRAVPPNALAVTSWTLEITTEGGITGSGSGGLTVSSDGKVGILFLGDRVPRCTFQLDSIALDSLNALITRAAPSGWVASYVPAALGARCCDIITTTMKLTRRDGNREDVYITQWMFTGPQMPTDLGQVIDAVSGSATSLRSRFVPLCGSTP